MKQTTLTTPNNTRKVYTRMCKRCSELFETYARFCQFCQTCSKNAPSKKIYPYIYKELKGGINENG